MSLRDFGGGYDPDTANPEDDCNKLLSQWLARQESASVHWDRKKSYGHGTFSTNTSRTPDLVVTADGGNFAMEVKRARQSSKVYDGAIQAYQYWKDIEDGQAEYSVDGETVDIEAVLLATRHSPEGHLFHDKQNKDVKRTGRGKNSQDALERDLMPEVEHASSETLIRVLHRFARRYYRENDEVEAKTGIGGLYSSVLDGDESGISSATPAAYHIAPGRGNKATNWDYIPWYKEDGL